MKTIYLAGPMTGLPDFNFPEFNRVAKIMRDAGYTVSNPAEINANVGASWADCLRRDIPELLKCEGIYLLTGWHNSKGAKLEYHITQQLGMQIEFQSPTGLFEVDAEYQRRQRAAIALYNETMSTP